MIECMEFRQQAEQWMEGERPPEAATHLKDCPNCRGLVQDLEAIRETAGQFAADDFDPPARLWTSLRAQLESEGLIREPSWTKRFAAWFPTLPGPALAGAYVAVLLIAIVLAGVESNLRRNEETMLRQAQPAQVLLRQQLSREEQRTVSTMHEHNPAVRASLRDNLAIVDNFISLCEKSVREEPRNDLAREYLYGAYQQKAELLATLTERGATAE